MWLQTVSMRLFNVEHNLLFQEGLKMIFKIFEQDNTKNMQLANRFILIIKVEFELRGIGSVDGDHLISDLNRLHSLLVVAIACYYWVNIYNFQMFAVH